MRNSKLDTPTGSAVFISYKEERAFSWGILVGIRRMEEASGVVAPPTNDEEAIAARFDAEDKARRMIIIYG